MRKEILRTEHITKFFLETRALHDVRMVLFKGEILGLIGLNWSGKSTLVKVISGDVSADNGLIFFDGKQVPLDIGSAFRRTGVYYIGQDSSLVSKMSVKENVFLKRNKNHRVLINETFEGSEINRILVRLGLDIDADAKVEDLSIEQNHLVHICIAVARKSKIIILDGITGTYSNNAVEKLISLLKRLKEMGISVIYVNNRLDDVFQNADRVMVLKEGRNLWTLNNKEFTKAKIMQLLSAHEMKEDKEYVKIDSKREVYRASRLSISNAFKDIDFVLREREVLGFAIKDARFRKKLAESLFGLNEATRGDILIDGKKINLKDASSAIRSGIGYVSQQSYRSGLFNNLSLVKNIAIMFSRKADGILGTINADIEQYVADDFVKAAGLPEVKRRSLDDLNDLEKFKLSMQRWMVIKPKILVLCNPTLGFDMIARNEIYAMIRQITTQGISVILISSDIYELAELSDRILLFGKDELVCEISNQDVGSKEILKERILRSFI